LKTKVYEYAKCGTCRKALQFLDKKKVAYEKSDITVNPPSLAEIKAMLARVGDIRKLFNTSGLVYKELGLAKKLPSMSETDALKLLASNGRLIKRPFFQSEEFAAVGFKEEEWKKHFR
jgi:arsenate reductase